MEARLTEPTATDHRASQFHYDRVQRFLHWSMAAIIIAAIGIGIYCGYQVPGTQPRKFLLDIHKSLGITALASQFASDTESSRALHPTARL
jgi:cytochrome b561